MHAAQKIIFYDERGAWRYVEPQQGRAPVLIYNGQDLMVLNSEGEPMRLLPSASSPDTVLLEGLSGEYYAIKPDVNKVGSPCLVCMLSSHALPVLAGRDEAL